MPKQTDASRVLIDSTLLQTRLFADWPKADFDRICAAAELRRYAKGACIIRAGSKVEGPIFIVSGTVTTERTLANGKRAVFEYLLPGQMTAVLPTFDGLPAGFDVMAKETAHIVFVPAAPLLAMLAAHPDKWGEVVQMLCRRSRLDFENIHLRMLNSHRCQLAKAIIYLARGPQMPGEFKVPLGITQDDIATFLGLSRQTVNREMALFLRDGVVAWRYRQIHILDAAKLMAVIDQEDPIPPEIRAALFERPKTKLSGAD